MAIVTGFQTIETLETSDGQILIQQPNHAGELNLIVFPPDRADAVIAAIKAVKREIAAKPETPAA